MIVLNLSFVYSITTSINFNSIPNFIIFCGGKFTSGCRGTVERNEAGSKGSIPTAQGIRTKQLEGALTDGGWEVLDT